MSMPRTSRDHDAIRREFTAVVNMSAPKIAPFLATDHSRKLGFARPGEAESVGRRSGRRIIAILDPRRGVRRAILGPCAGAGP